MVLRTGILASLVHGASSAGMLTHTMVAHRAFKYYAKVSQSDIADKHNDAIQQHIDAVHAGGDFPDFLYACGSDHDAGEAAHWPAWQAAATEYIRKRPDFQSGDWSEDTKKLVAFLYGVSVHYVADEFWEGLNGELGRGQGFVRFLSSFNLQHDGRSDNDESVANMAGDFFVSYGMDNSEVKPWARFFPIDDILNIYHEYNYDGKTYLDVTKASLLECEVIFDLGLWAEKEFGQFLFHAWTALLHKVPMPQERVVDMPIGGIDDMAVWSSWVWERIAKWLDHGAPEKPSPNFRRLQSDSGKIDEADAWLRDFVQALKPLEPWKDLLVKFTGAELVKLADPNNPLSGLIYIGAKELFDAVKQLLDHFQVYATRAAPAGADTSVITRCLTIVGVEADSPPPALEAAPLRAADSSGSVPVAYHGSALASGDFDGDGQPDLAVGAYGTGEAGSPQRGLVELTYGSGASSTLAGPMAHGRFGWALQVVDFNLDGVDDLAVSAPTAAWDNQLPITENDTPYVRFWGRVYVFLGQKGSGLASDAAVSLVTQDELTGLGLSLAAGDLNGDGHADLMVGAPMSSFKAQSSWADEESIQRGAVFGFYSQADQAAERDARKTADLVLEGEAGYSWFGQSTAVVGADDDRLLLVGAPAARNAMGNTTGQLLLYKMGEETKLAATITGDEAVAEFGHSLAVSKAGMVAVSSPAASGAGLSQRGGEVRLIDTSKLQELATKGGDVALKDVQVAATISGSTLGDAFGRLGWHVAFEDVSADGTDDLVAGAPLTNAGVSLPEQRERGAVYVWDGTRLPTGSVETGSVHWKSQGQRGVGRFGSATAVGPKGQGLAVGSPGASQDKEMAGAVDILPVSFSSAISV